MTGRKRFFIGGAGALMPILITLMSIDFITMFDTESGVSIGHIIGFVTRYIILFTIGGIIAYLHEDETKAFKLFQIGIAAPALVTSLITANGINSEIQQKNNHNESSFNFNIISSAYAYDEKQTEPSKEQSVLNDILQGISGSAYKNIYIKKSNLSQEVGEEEPTNKTIDDTESENKAEESKDEKDPVIVIEDISKQEKIEELKEKINENRRQYEEYQAELNKLTSHDPIIKN